MNDNVLRVNFYNKTKITARPLYQYDYGQKLKFLDLKLPTNYEVHFSNYEHGTSTTNIGNSDGVLIPDAYLQTGLPIYAWVYIHTGLDDGETEYKVTIPVNKRAQPSNATPSQVQQDVITQTLAALNNAVTLTSTNSVAAASAALDASAARDGTHAYMLITKGYKESIETALSSNYITIGSTRLTETQLQQLLTLIE